MGTLGATSIINALRDRAAGEDKIRPAILEHRWPGTSVKAKRFDGAGALYDRPSRARGGGLMKQATPSMPYDDF